MDGISAVELRTKVNQALTQQGFVMEKEKFSVKDFERETKRQVHTVAKLERLSKHTNFLLKNLDLVKSHMIDGNQLDVAKIQPTLRLVQSGSDDEKIFKWWNLAWWSLPYERAYGRQMRFIVWDEYHDAPMGLIGLQSPILSWSVRDNYLGITAERRDYWVNQSMSAQRLGALPPYNFVLGGKLVGAMLTSNTIREAFEQKYADKLTVIKGRILPARLLFITTTGAFGKSSVYSRLKHKGIEVAKFIGMTKGSGTFHIPDSLFKELVGFLASMGVDTRRGYGSGPSTKMRLINQALKALDIKKGSMHGIQRAVYLFPLAENLKEVIESEATPVWYERTEEDIAAFWRERWAIPRSQRDTTYKSFKSNQVIDDMLREIQ